MCVRDAAQAPELPLRRTMDKDKARAQRASRRRPIEIVLPRARRDGFVRVCGPALAPLRIALKNDSTAYIAGKEVWPTIADSGGVKLQLHYIVKWTDLPAASVLVDAHELLDYVSPRTLEDYEYQLSLERDTREEEYKEKAAKASEAKRAAVEESKHQALQPKAATTDTSTGTSSATPATGQKKRGRPSKADILARQKTTKSEVEVRSPMLPSGTNTSGPSLSTPRKTLGMVADQLALDEDFEGEHGPNDEATAQQPSFDSTMLNALVGKYSQRPSLVAKSPHRFSAHPTSTGKITNPLRQDSQRFGRVASAGGFTPAACSAGKWPSPSPSPSRGPVGSPETPSSSKKAPASSRKRKRKEANKAEITSDEAVWIVKRLEADTMLEVDGKMQRCFQVKWEGNWPPDQSPTWEPEINLPKELVRQYLKKAANSNRKAKDARKTARRSLIRKYSSVAEAFEGDIEEKVVRHPTLNDDGVGMNIEERLMVEECERTVEPVKPPPPPPTASFLDFAGVRPFTSLNGNNDGPRYHSATANTHL